MNRRGFLSFVGLGAAGMVLDPEALLWRPGARRIFLPPPGGWSGIAGLAHAQRKLNRMNSAIMETFSVERIAPIDYSQFTPEDWALMELGGMRVRNMTLQEFRSRYLRPAMEHAFDTIDADCLRFFREVA